MSDTTVRPKINPRTAFEQMQRARAQRAKPKRHTSESAGFKVETPKPTLAETGKPVDIEDVTPEALAATDAEPTARGDKIDDNGTWSDRPTENDGLYPSSWLCSAAEVGLGNWRGRLRQFTIIDERDPMEVLNDDEFVGFHAARA